MKHKIQFKWLVLAVGIAVLAAGLFTAFYAFNKVQTALLQEYDEHLLDLGKAVDRNLENMLERCRYELEREVSRPRIEEAQRVYEKTGNEKELDLAVQNSIESHKGYLDAIIVFDEETQIVSTNGKTSIPSPDFSAGKGLDDICIYMDEEGTEFIGFKAISGGLTYIGTVKLDVFYQAIVVDSLQEEYWVVLYNSESGIILENNGNVPTLHEYSTEELSEREDGYSILLVADREGKTLTESYSYTDNDTKNHVRCRIAAISSSNTRNGLFSLGLAANYGKIIGPITKVTGWLILSICMISGVLAAGMFAWYRIYARYRRTKQNLKETKELLENQEKTAHSQRMELVGLMTASISHNFNNMLTPIMGYSLMILESEKEDSPTWGFATEIYQAGEKCKEMIERLSALTRKNTGLSYTDISPDEVAMKAIRIAGYSKPETITIETEFTCGDVLLSANESQVLQVLLNLLLNAFKAIGDREGTVRVRTTIENQNAVFTVADNGIGVPEEIRERIFEPFFTTKEAGQGTGLGLAISRQTARAHGGELALASNNGKGAEFILTLPLQR